MCEEENTDNDADEKHEKVLQETVEQVTMQTMLFSQQTHANDHSDQLIIRGNVVWSKIKNTNFITRLIVRRGYQRRSSEKSSGFEEIDENTVLIKIIIC